MGIIHTDSWLNHDDPGDEIARLKVYNAALHKQLAIIESSENAELHHLREFRDWVDKQITAAISNADSFDDFISDCLGELERTK